VIDAGPGLDYFPHGKPERLHGPCGGRQMARAPRVAVIETLLISDLFLVVDVAESAWNIEMEDKLIKDVKAFVG